MSGMEAYRYTPDTYLPPELVVSEASVAWAARPIPHQERELQAWQEPLDLPETAQPCNPETGPLDKARAEHHTPSAPEDIDDRDVSLSGLAQYMRELRQKSPISRATEAIIVEQARCGDQASKHLLIEDRLPYIMHMATRYHVYAEHEDLMDIVGVANLAVTAHLDRALTKDNPAAYLCGIAKREIRTYCFYHSRLIPIKNHHMPSADVPTIVSLDEQRATMPCHSFGPPIPDQPPDIDRAQREQFHEALDQLPDRDRQVVDRRHGLQDGICEEFTDIAQALAVTRPTVYRRYYRALGKLRELVAMSLPVLDERATGGEVYAQEQHTR